MLCNYGFFGSFMLACCPSSHMYEIPYQHCTVLHTTITTRIRATFAMYHGKCHRKSVDSSSFTNRCNAITTHSREHNTENKPNSLVIHIRSLCFYFLPKLPSRSSSLFSPSSSSSSSASSSSFSSRNRRTSFLYFCVDSFPRIFGLFHRNVIRLQNKNDFYVIYRLLNRIVKFVLYTFSQFVNRTPCRIKQNSQNN